MREVLSLLAERYRDCLGVDIDDRKRKVTIQGGPQMYFVRHRRYEFSVFNAENGLPNADEPKIVTSDRHFCPYDLSGAAPWAQRAFAGKQIKQN